MKKVKVIPISEYAKDRVEEHGEIMELHPDSDKLHAFFLVVALDGSGWMDWLEYAGEATYEMVKE